ncbi:MAG: flavodoxin family protein [Theionarchaea archaeon]|nr:flavodoxin family protein [Theionarchaea archaeon]
MKALMVLGCRNRTGRTARSAQAMVEGMESAGCEVESIYLPELNIERCRQCDDDGWGKCRKRDECNVEDDFPSIVEKIREADVLAFTTPVYYSDLSESMRGFLDRLRRIARHDSGGIRGKSAIGVCLAGGGGGGAPACAASIDRALSGCGFDVEDVVPVRRQNLELKLGLLRETGKWFASRS